MPSAKTPSKFAVTAKNGRKTQGGERPRRLSLERVAASNEDGDVSDASEASSEADEDEGDIDLKGFSSESDSSDEDTVAGDEAPLDASLLPTFAKDDATVQRKLEMAKRKPTEDCGVIYLGRIPHGFYEDQMRRYFSQFGDVTRLRLSRNRKTGRSKHYAFIEFSSSAVAEIVSETMDNFLLMGHILQCRVIPKDKIHPELWVGANRKWRKVPRDKVARARQNKRRTEEERRRAECKLISRQKRRQARVAALGIDYDFADVGYIRAQR